MRPYSAIRIPQSTFKSSPSSSDPLPPPPFPPPRGEVEGGGRFSYLRKGFLQYLYHLVNLLLFND